MNVDQLRIQSSVNRINGPISSNISRPAVISGTDRVSFAEYFVESLQKVTVPKVMSSIDAYDTVKEAIETNKAYAGMVRDFAFQGLYDSESEISGFASNGMLLDTCV